jgi:hypothetical protein
MIVLRHLVSHLLDPNNFSAWLFATTVTATATAILAVLSQ